MPQMAPINWVILLIYFIMIFFITNSLNYFIMIPKINHFKKNTINKSLFNWKW